MSKLPIYDEIDRILNPQAKIDLKSFLRESYIGKNRHKGERLEHQSCEPPQYRCTVSRSGRVFRKLENTTDDLGNVQTPFRRRWSEVDAVVRGTKLEIYRAGYLTPGAVSQSHENGAQVKTNRFSAHADPNTAKLDEPFTGLRRVTSLPLLSRPSQRNDLLVQYSLLGAVIGVACDYTKRENVLRIRAGPDQFLIQCNGSRDALGWMEVIQQGANIAAPLDTRDEPTFVTAPRRRRPDVRTRNQTYAVFEAASAEAPLRPRAKTIASSGVTNHSRSYVRSVIPLNRHNESSHRRSASDQTPVVEHETLSAQSWAFLPRLKSAQSLTHAAHNTPDPGATRTNRVRPERARSERFVCAILAADHPRPKPTKSYSVIP